MGITGVFFLKSALHAADFLLFSFLNINIIFKVESIDNTKTRKSGVSIHQKKKQSTFIDG